MTGEEPLGTPERGEDRCHSLDEVVDGELSAAAADRLRRHVAQCPECAEEIERARRVKELVRRCCGSETAPRALRERITVEYRRVSVQIRTEHRS